MKISTKIILGFSVPILMFFAFGFWLQLVMVNVSDHMRHVMDESVAFALTAKDMETDVAQIQQFLSDISATRALDGLDDGFKEAEIHYNEFNAGLAKFEQLFVAKGNQKGVESSKLIRANFDAFYANGVQMAHAYIDGGPPMGNKLMPDFDKASLELQNLLSPFIKAQLDEMDASVARAKSDTDKVRLTGLMLGLLLIIISALVARTTVLVFSRYITGRKQAEIAMRESEERLRATIETSMDAVVQIDAGGVITGWNSQMEEIFGWPRAEAIGRAIHETIIPTQHRVAHIQGMKHFLLTGEGAILNTRIEITGLHRNGHEFPIELTIAPIKMGGKYEFSAFIRDITKKKESDEIIWKQANFDTLTGLPNRHMFCDRIGQEIKKAKRANFNIALLFIDLDRFKEVNDTLGHDMGDILLVEAARRITDCVRTTDIVARLGGDEFTVMLAEIDDVSSVERVVQNILQRLATVFKLKDEMLYVSASIGITLYPNDADTVEGLFKNADQAMYVAKEQGRNRHSYFTHVMQETAQGRLRLINDLRGALAANQLMVYFQPIVELATGNVHKAEALIRWKHPERGMVSPAEFIPLAEDTGLIYEIGDWVFHESMRWVKRWRASHNPLLQISVNKSPLQFYKDGAEHTVWLSHLLELGLTGQSLAIEITEGLLMASSTLVNDELFSLRDAGIQVSLDDFGTGYSSLSYLKKFHIDYLKIDQSFVCDLASDPNDLALAEAIIVMGHKLGIRVIAEGVETREQLKLLMAAGCDYAQGYLFSRPVPPEEFEKLLTKGAISILDATGA